MIPELSLSVQLEQEMDRRAAARMSRDQLHEKMDELIQSWYLQHELINRLLGRVRMLEVQAALGEPVPARRSPEERHVQWAKELMGWG